MHTTAFIALSALLGLALGSFYAASAYRWINELSIVRPARSFCPSCAHPLSWRENIPLASFLIQRGRCRHCAAPIHWRYPSLELASLVWGGLAAWRFGPGAEWAVAMVFGGILLTASWIDLESYLLPDVLTIPGAVLAVAAFVFVLGPEGAGRAANWTANLKTSLIGLGLGGGVFLVLHYGYKWLRGADGLGLGDVKLMCLIGALLGPRALPFVILVGALSALLCSAAWVVRGRREAAATAESYGENGAEGQASGGDGDEDGGEGTSVARTPIPFGPFLAFAALLWLLRGPEIWGWYLRMMR
ncbi:MAG: A24 family peptidase [Desulfovibrionaceae bacterium]